jgi:hypothetical protein
METAGQKRPVIQVADVFLLLLVAMVLLILGKSVTVLIGAISQVARILVALRAECCSVIRAASLTLLHVQVALLVSVVMGL